MEEKPSILLVEDQIDSQTLTVTLLKSKYDLKCAVSADQALALLDGNSFDLILMDVGLAYGMDGVELTRYLRTMNAYAKIPIIALTAYGINSQKHIFFDAGMNDYLPKPFTRSQLIEVIERWLPRDKQG